MKIHLLAGALVYTPGAYAYEAMSLPFEPTPLPIVAAQQVVANTAIPSPIGHQGLLAGFAHRSPIDPRGRRPVSEEQTEGTWR
tara:strand:+ start:1707 stop:1955 length:249 start_codon:yes stop_codon:yes gene_type:complete